MLRPTISVMALGVAVLASGCSADVTREQAALRPTASRRDSSGIEIVENELPSQKLVAFHVDSAPLADIGLREGPTEYLLSGVRGAVQLSNNQIVVAESDARLRFFDATGKHLRTLNFRGEGPDELESIRDMRLHGRDSLLITCCVASTTIRSVDVAGKSTLPSNRTLLAVVLDSSGRMLRKAPVSWPLAPIRVSAGGTTLNGDIRVSLFGITSNGFYLARGSVWADPTGKPGRFWLGTPYFRIPFAGTGAETLAVLPAQDRIEDSDGTVRWLRFNRNAPEPAIDKSSLYWGNADSFEIHVYDATSAPIVRPTRIVRYALPNRRMEGALLERYYELELGTAMNKADSNEYIEERGTRPANATLPAFDKLHVDSNGNLWVLHARLIESSGSPFDRNEPQIWTVFDASGALLGDVETPTGLNITQIGRDFLIGIWRDYDDVEHVRKFRIRSRR